MSSDEIPGWAPDVAEAILQTVLKKDPFTFYHCCRVGRAARKMGKLLELPDYEQNILEFSGLFSSLRVYISINVTDRKLIVVAKSH